MGRTVLVVVSLLFLSKGAMAERPEAVVLKAEGNVWVKEKDREEWSKIMPQMELSAGDIIRTGTGSTARLLLAEGRIKRLSEKERFVIKPSKETEKTSLATIAKNIWTLFEKKEAEEFEVGAVRLRDDSGGVDLRIKLLSPRYSKITSTQPTFSWQGIPGAHTYQIVLEDEDKELWQYQTQQTEADYEGTLTAGIEYLWYVRVKRGNEWFESESVSFELLPKDELIRLQEVEEELKKNKELSPKTEDFYIIMGLLWEKCGAYDEAGKYYRKLSQLFPQNEEAHKLLANLYQKIGLYEEALKELKKAVE